MPSPAESAAPPAVDWAARRRGPVGLVAPGRYTAGGVTVSRRAVDGDLAVTLPAPSVQTPHFRVHQLPAGVVVQHDLHPGEIDNDLATHITAELFGRGPFRAARRSGRGVGPGRRPGRRRRRRGAAAGGSGGRAGDPRPHRRQQPVPLRGSGHRQRPPAPGRRAAGETHRVAARHPRRGRGARPLHRGAARAQGRARGRRWSPAARGPGLASCAGRRPGGRLGGPPQRVRGDPRRPAGSSYDRSADMSGGSFRYLFSPLRVGPVVLANRIVFAAHLTNFAEDGRPSDQHVAYYAARAAGGTGLIITEEHSVHPTDWPYEKLIHGYHADVVPGYRRITEAVHQHGVPIFAQINHNGGQASSMYSRLPIWAASPVGDPLFREVPKEIEDHEIAEVVAGYAGSPSTARWVASTASSCSAPT